MATVTERHRAAVLGLAVSIAMVGPWTRAAAAPAPMRDEPRSVVVLPLTVQGTLPPALEQAMFGRLRQGVDPDARTAELAPGTATCTDAACWRERAGSWSATHVVHVVVAVDDRDYDVSAELVDGRTGEVIATAANRCEICGYDELGATFDDVAGLLRRKLASSTTPLPMLSIGSTPAGALVSIDGAPVGNTPLELELAAGAHDVQVTRPGHVPQLRRVVLVDGVREQLTLALPITPVDPTVRRGPPPLRVAGATLTAFGIAGVGVGIGVAVLDEAPIRSRCSGENVDIEGHCRYRYDSLAAGVSVAVIGGAMLVSGIALLVVDRRRGRATRVAARPGGLAIAF